jgi:phosphoglucosamine mutase
MSNKKFFGTDGVRGEAGTFPLTKDFIEKLAISTGNILLKKDSAKNKKVIIGMDTRESGNWIFEALCLGFNRNDFFVDFVGVVSTPALSFFTSNGNYDCGVMISASHNPYFDNGIKFFSNKGEKFEDLLEMEIEKEILDILDIKYTKNENGLKYSDISEKSYDEYLKFLKGLDIFSDGFNFENSKVVLDCSNGSLYKYAKNIFIDFGAETNSIYDSPNGKNINENCGSTKIENLLKFLLDNSADFDIAFAFDGDGDRVIGIKKIDDKNFSSDLNLKILDGDILMGILSKYFKQKKGYLDNNLLILTVMSNLGLKNFLNSEEIDFFETKVGDKYVYEALKEKSAFVGGEQSGHIILRKYANTGDGLLVALVITKILEEIGNEEFNNWVKNIKILPQILVNVKLKTKVDIFDNEKIKKYYDEIEKKLSGKGRVFIRYSGTEPLLRIMMEGEDYEEIKALANNFADKIQEEFCSIK